MPKIGSKEKLVELAAQNAKLVLSQDREKLKREEGRTIGAVKEISDLLQLPLTGTARMEENVSCRSVVPDHFSRINMISRNTKTIGFLQMKTRRTGTK